MMGFEGAFKRKQPKEEMDEIAKKGEIDNRKRLLAAVGATAAGVAAIEGVGAVVHQQNEALEHPVPAAAPVTAENPTAGMKSSDAPPSVTVPLPREAAPQQQVVVDLGEKNVVIDLGEKTRVINMPER